MTRELWSSPPQPGDLEPFRLGSGDAGVLLVHGFCGTPPEVRGWGEHLAQHGFRVHGALITGHGRTPEELELTSWQDWVASAQAQLDALKRECPSVCVGGQSMGGTLALLLAARNPDVAAVATTSALVSLGLWPELQIRVGRRLRHWHYPNRQNIDLWDRAAVNQLRSYNRRALKSHTDLVALYRQARLELPQIKAPALIIHGRRDRVVPPRNARLIAEAIGPSATVRFFERDGHAMTVDVDKEEVFALTTEHFQRATGLGARGIRVPGETAGATGESVPSPV
jgi:carboxylesterase